MNILIACEHSAIVRDAFTSAGANATSCDFLPSSTPGQHYQGNVLDILNDGYDCLIGFPPCTFLTYAGNSSWFNPGRAADRLKALDFFLKLWNAPIDHIALENPAGIIHSIIEPYTQIIHPYYFGDHDLKRTYLWLKNLPPLIHAPERTLFYAGTHVLKPYPYRVQPSGRKVYFTDQHNTKSTRAKLRSITFPGVAQAMVDQWLPFITTYRKDI